MLVLAGVSIAAVGVWWIYPPAALIVFGAAATAGGLLLPQDGGET